jgi:ADP-heptose:LPS heptosyltransferase
MPTLPQRLLIVRLSAMGDAAMCVPVLLALHRAYPEVELVMLSRKRFQPLFKNIPNLTFVAAKLDQEHKGAPGLYRLAQELKAHRIDAIADLHDVLRTKILRTFLYGIPKSVIDKGRSDKKQLVNDPDFFKPLKHTTERYADVFRNLGFELDLKNGEFLPQIPLDEDILNITEVKNKKWIAVAPFAAHQTKSLKINRAKKIVKQLAALEDVQVFLFGGGAREIKKLELVAATTAHVTLVAGRLNFTQELALISNLDAMIAMDSGNGHLAALYHVPVITLWGNTHPYAGFAPYAQPAANQLTADRSRYPLIPTSIFGDKKVDGYKKITNTIKVKHILNRVKEILGD